MKFQQFLNIVLQILTNWYVLGTLIAMLLIISFANYVIRYKKKPKKKKKKNTAEAPKPKKPATPPPEAENNEASENDKE